jgi:hypothetical protein
VFILPQREGASVTRVIIKREGHGSRTLVKDLVPHRVFLIIKYILHSRSIDEVKDERSTEIGCDIFRPLRDRHDDGEDEISLFELSQRGELGTSQPGTISRVKVERVSQNKGCRGIINALHPFEWLLTIELNDDEALVRPKTQQASREMKELVFGDF